MHHYLNNYKMTTTNNAENLYMHLNASELSAIIMKGSPSSNDRDAGFCSGSSEGGDDLSVDHSRLEPCSPTDGSEDSLEVKVTPISLVRNKRKSSEPSKVICEREESAIANGPLKKRIRYTSSADSGVVLTPPIVSITTAATTTTIATPPPQTQLWDPSQVLPHELMPNPAEVFVRHPGVTTLHRLPIAAGENNETEQIEPLALVLKKHSTNEITCQSAVKNNASSLTVKPIMTNIFHRESNTPAPENVSAFAPSTSSSPSASPALATVTQPARVHTSDSLPSLTTLNGNESSTTTTSTATIKNGTRPQQRNYKNMTRERRIEANARERTRVHTISAAYETLRRAVPSYSNAQKLSKLSVLRVACSYILTLSRMAGDDYTEDQTAPSIASCFDAVTATIQTEGKIRKKKDE